ncbi:proline-rich family protein [Raphanus sativus]|uniref:Uncharacterized protein LOC108841995 n=1 Tax=Raphanus sativus TaxID=3726 RepID=A0A6J0MCN1_RAPSA|nr:uncharacterized protein LOC108841995 [Raphanus sativus]XP_056858703.1 uncharacterized protein LOC108841995 [Raphanus sativus]KAJ4911522.1 proline-rich family protein [Raphanus sativus]
MSSQRYALRRTAADNFLYSEDEKSDYDWLVTPPGSPNKSSVNQLDAPDATLTMALKSRLENCREEERDRTSSKNQTIGLKRPSSSNSSRSTIRPSTPARRSTTPATRSTPPTSHVISTGARPNLTSSSTSNSRSTSRPSTPTRRPSSSGTSRATSTAARVTLTSSSTCTTSSTSRPSTPPRRPSTSGTSRANLTTSRATTSAATSARSNTRPMSTPSTKPGSRSSTPTRRPPTPTGSSTVSRSKPTKPVCKPAAPLPSLRSRPWEPYEMPGFSLEAPSNLRTTLPDRPQTASSRRTTAFGASSSRSASIERTVTRRQSCSPSRNRVPIGNAKGPGRAKTSNDDGGGLISPVAKGVQMVERVVSARKLAPPRLTEKGGSNAGKSSSGADGVGFGRNLSKSSFDMALRHMDIKQGSMKGNFRQLATKVPAASLYSVRSSGTRRKRPVSSSGSSESSSVIILCLDGSDDNISDISY